MISTSQEIPGKSAIVLRGDPSVIGKVASPQGSESTSEEFTFWVPEGTIVEKTQIVRAVSDYCGQIISFHAIVDEVHRRSRRRDVLEEADRYGSDVGTRIPLDSQGITYATAKILASVPAVMAPPREESPVYLASASEAQLAYGVERMAHPLSIGLLKNGGSAYAGSAYIDLDYLLGANGAHLNVNGVSGVATKSSFLLCVLYSLLAHCRRIQQETPSAPDRPMVVPVILNVKSTDLFWLDRWNRRYLPEEEAGVWDEMGLGRPEPFGHARFLAPEQGAARAPVPIGRPVESYSWSLADIVERGLFAYLFGEEDRDDENFLGLLQDIEAFVTEETHNAGRGGRSLKSSAPSTFEKLLEWVRREAGAEDRTRALQNHHTGTWRKFYRRLRRVVHEGEGVLVRHLESGKPLDVTADGTRDPIVIDLQSIRDLALQRFVVAALFAQVSETRTGTDAVPNLTYLIVLDELNRFAPKGASDAITRLIEKVVSEMRSQGVILFGAQQQASQVSPRVIENCSIRVLGRTGSLELDQPLWSFLGRGPKRRAAALQPNEKLVYQVNFREPMQVRMPYPCWAMRRDDAKAQSTGGFDSREEWEE